MASMMNRLGLGYRVCQRATMVLLLVLASALVGPATSAVAADAGHTFAGLDAHDGTVVQVGSTYYLYGTRYGCGFTWGVPNSPFCGFGVWSSVSLAGPWIFERMLFDPNGTNPERGNEPWRTSCSWAGNGCFNPRMVQRSDGVWILYFNVPGETQRGRNNAYYAMGCNGPAGPCGLTAGAPHGSTHAMSMRACHKNGDFSVVVDGATAYLACSDGRITIEQLDQWWTNGIADNTTGAGAVREISYLSNVEAPGLFKADTGQWVMTYSDPMCGYCAGTTTSYSVSSNGVLGVWLPPDNPGFAPPLTGRARISGTSCGGQPRTIFIADGQPYQWIDTWYGAANETNANIRLEPLVVTGPLIEPADGTPWGSGIAPFQCGA